MRDKTSREHWKTLTFLAALRHHRIDAPCVLDKPVDGPASKVHVEPALVSMLAPADVVILDNLGSQTGEVMRRAIHRAGCALVVPAALQPGLNPIERVFTADIQVFISPRPSR